MDYDDYFFYDNLYRLSNQTNNNKGETGYEIFLKLDSKGKIIVIFIFFIVLFILNEISSNFPLIRKLYKKFKVNCNISIKNVKRYRINDECPICKDILDIDKSIVRINCKCRYIYHRDCILKWFNINSNCPFCRCKI